MRHRLFTLQAAVSLLVGIALAALWFRARAHSDVGLYTTSPYEHAVQHSIGFGSSNGRVSLELDSNYSPSLLESNHWGGFQEAFDENWGMYRRSDLTGTAEPWPPWGDYGGTPMKSGFSFRYWRDASLCQRSVWIPYWFLTAMAAILPAKWGWRRWAPSNIGRRRARGLCPACGYDLRASAGRCPECGKMPADVEAPSASRRVIWATAILVLLAACGAAGVFWMLDSRDRTPADLTPDGIAAALKPGMLEYQVDDLLHLPQFGPAMLAADDPRCCVLADGSTLVCNYHGQQYQGDGQGSLVSFERLRLDDLTAAIPADRVAALHQIQCAPPGLGNVFDPIALIRGVNALQRLGKADALAALRQYVSLARQDRQRAFRYDLDERRAFLIARILFQPPADQPAALSIPDVPYARETADVNDWPQYPLFVQNDIPFCVDDGYKFALNRDYSQIDDVAAFLERCQRDGVMRAAPLAPTRTPLEALDAMVKAEHRRRYAGEDVATKAVTMLRIQAIRAISPLFTLLRHEDWTHLELATGETSDRIWSHLLHDDRLKRMRWDAGTQSFVIREGG